MRILRAFLWISAAGIGLTLSAPATYPATPAPFASPSPSPSDADAGWETVFTQNGIKVSRRRVEGSKVYAVRAVGTVASPFAKLVGVLRDTAKKPLWMKMLAEARVIKETGNERLEYYHFRTPFIIKDRDLLVQTLFTIDREHRQVVFTARSVDDPSVPEKPELVRARVISARITLSPVDGGKSTLIDTEAHAEPRGSVPSWATNLLQRKAPKQSIEDLLKRVAATDVPDYPGLDFASPPAQAK